MLPLLLAYLLITFITTILCAYLARYAWQRPQILGARFLALCLLAIVEITIAFLGLSFSANPEQGYFWARIRFLGLAFASYFFFLFVAEYSAWTIPRPLLMLLGVPAIITQIFVWTALDRLFFVDWQLIDLGIIRIDSNGYTGWFNVHINLANAFLITAFFRLLYYAFRVESSKRSAVWFIIFGTTAALLLALPAFNRPEWMLPKWTPIGMGIMGLSMAFALFRLEFFGVIPIAYDVIVQNIRAAVFILNPGRQILQINPFAENMLQTKAESVSQTAIETIFQHYFGQSFPPNNDEQVWEFQNEKAGQLYHYEATLSCLRRRNFLLGYLLTVRDISIYKEAEAQELALNLEKERLRLLSEFIRNTSHDLRNPLATINSSVYVLQKSDDKERRAKALERLTEQSAHIDKLLTQFHSFLELESGDTQDMSRISVQDLLNQQAEKYRPLISKYQIALHYTAPEHDLFVKADSEYLRQAIQALIENAILYNQPQGEIFLQAEEKAGNVHIIVRDTGIGIAPEKLDQIFQSFYKGNEARTHDGSGAGLGLALARRVATLHHGDIQLESEVGKGTTARFILPLWKENQD